MWSLLGLWQVRRRAVARSIRFSNVREHCIWLHRRLIGVHVLHVFVVQKWSVVASDVVLHGRQVHFGLTGFRQRGVDETVVCDERCCVVVWHLRLLLLGQSCEEPGEVVLCTSRARTAYRRAGTGTARPC